MVTRCVSCSSRHWPACQGGCVFREPWTSTTPTAWRPWGCWSSRWPSLPYMSSGRWYVQGLYFSSRYIMITLHSIIISAIKLEDVKMHRWALTLQSFDLVINIKMLVSSSNTDIYFFFYQYVKDLNPNITMKNKSLYFIYLCIFFSVSPELIFKGGNLKK